MIRRLTVVVAMCAAALLSFADGSVVVKSVEAHQRYPWNGLVDIVVTMEGTAEDVALTKLSVVATNSAAKAAIPVTSITQKGNDNGSGTIWTRRFIWNATNDVGAVKIEDVALTVDISPLGGVQLWKNGPYWAECNVGATKPEEYGYYFRWGDTVGYKWNGSKAGFVFYSNRSSTYGKDYSQLQSDGYIDSAGNLVAAHDAATAHLGAPWRMPTDAEFSALISNCTTTFTTRNGVCGRLVTGKGAYALKSIFLPAAGWGADCDRYYAGDYGQYWTSIPCSGSCSAFSLFFHSGKFCRNSNERYDGQPVRPVRGFANNIGGVSAYLKLDSRTCVRACSANGESLRYDASWYENGDEVRITENGAVVTSGTSGVYTWCPPSCSARHLLKLEVLSSGQVVGTETVEFESAATLAHVEVITTAAREPTCTEDGCTKGSYCSRCNEVLATSQTIAALGHIEVVTTAARAATCIEAGCKKGSYCSRCNAVLATSTVLAALGHAEVVTTVAKNPNCTENGCTKGAKCSRCNAVLAVSETLPELGHSGALTKAAVEPTSGAAGSTAEIRCSRCNELMQAAEVIPALGYVRNVTARQLWPHKKVEVCYEVADDIGEVACESEILSVWCTRGTVTNVATHILGDRSARPGLHRVVWDMEADGLRFTSDNTAFGVSAFGCVQLWENGPCWAECNVGASRPEEYGYYFWWGDTVGYKRNARNNGWVSVKDGTSYSFSSGSCPTYGKSNSALQSAGYIDSTGNLVAAHDAARTHLGASWRMPTDAEIAALIKNCDAIWTTLNGVSGRLMKGRGAYASKSIFLPAAGSGGDSRIFDTSSYGCYWSSSPSLGYSNNAWFLNFSSSYFSQDYYYRYSGRSVRPVRNSSK